MAFFGDEVVDSGSSTVRCGGDAGWSLRFVSCGRLSNLVGELVVPRGTVDDARVCCSYKLLAGER